jgi:hypothetical protein
MKCVYTAREPYSAHMVKAHLEDQGIAAIVQGERLASLAGEIPFADALPRVCVRDDDYEKAAGWVAEFLRRGGSGKISGRWKCPRCSEMVEGEFSECWKCGTEKIP